jgi:hypothetical protein
MKQIPLTQGRSVIVDDEDYERLVQWKWHAVRHRKTFYAVRTENRRPRYMHRVILEPAPGLDVDHVDFDGLNNTRANLRIATRQQNASNQRRRSDNMSGFKGVSLDRRGRPKPWVAEIWVNQKKIWLGMFATPEHAAAVYNEAATKYFGEFALLNEVL